jgi:hypothetical protein
MTYCEYGNYACTIKHIFKMHNADIWNRSENWNLYFTFPVANMISKCLKKRRCDQETVAYLCQPSRKLIYQI